MASELPTPRPFLTPANTNPPMLHLLHMSLLFSQFKDCKSSLLIATDVAARGLDVDDIKMVVNFDFPNDMDSYVHRIGRTGRAGKKGTSVSFFVPSKNARLARELIEILNRTEQVIPEQLASCAGGSYRSSGRRR